MNRENLALFIFAFVFYFIGDLATTYIALNNGLPELIFFTALFFLIVFLEKRDNYLCSAIPGLVAGMGMTVTWMNALVIMEYLG